jgi:lysophospholipase L1-like esterase
MTRRRPHVVAWSVLGLVLLAGCGGSGDEPEATPDGSAATAPAELRVRAPANGAEVTADDQVGARLSAKVPVRGSAGPGAVLVIESSCRTEADCRTPVTAAADGRFSASVEVWSLPGRKQGRIIVGPEGSPPEDRTRVTVLLVAKGGGGEPDEPEKRKTARTPDAAPESEATPRAENPAPPESQAPSPGQSPRTLVMIGDSLAEGTEPHLAGLLSGWSVTTDARRSRPLAEGMGILRSTRIPSGPVVLAFSLFTNDDPNAVAALESAVRTSVQRAGSDGCAVWATIARPPFNGVSYDRANARLRALAGELRGRLQVVPWAEAVASSPSLLASDHVHGTPEGYRVRAQMYAEAARACGG